LFVADLEALDVTVDQLARVIINERTGTVVCNSDVRISDAAIAHGGLTVEVKEAFYVSQPAAFSQGTTAIVPSSDVKANEKDAQMKLVSAGTNLQDVVKALNSLGVTPRDLIAILQALKASGALRAELDIQ
jgi:flagellar P-ring protein precursor FlgI